MRTKSKSTGTLSLAKIRTAIEKLTEISRDIETLGDEIPDFSFMSDGKKAKIGLFSATLNETFKVDFWKEVDSIGVDNGNLYHPNEMKFWLKTFREAADKVERNLNALQNNPDEWQPLED
jgi:hypothetical protein